MLNTEPTDGITAVMEATTEEDLHAAIQHALSCPECREWAIQNTHIDLQDKGSFHGDMLRASFGPELTPARNIARLHVLLCPGCSARLVKINEILQQAVGRKAESTGD